MLRYFCPPFMKWFIFQYSILVFVLLVLVTVGSILALTGDLKALKAPFFETLKDYKPEWVSNSAEDEALRDAWDSFQQDVRIGHDMNRRKSATVSSFMSIVCFIV